MKKLIPIFLIIAIMAAPAFARNSKMKGKDNPKLSPWLEEYAESLYKRNVKFRKDLDLLLITSGKLVDLVTNQQERITKLEEQLDYMAVRIGKLEENQKSPQDSEYPIFTPNKYNFSYEAE